MSPSEPPELSGASPEPGSPGPGWTSPQPGVAWTPPPPAGSFGPPSQDAPPAGPGYPPAGPPYPPAGAGFPTGAGYPPVGGGYGGSYPPPTPPKKRRGWLIALFVVLGVMVVGVGGCVAVAALGVRALTAPADAANRWLDELEGEVPSDELQALTCPGFRSELDRVQEVLARRGWDGGQDLTSTSIANGSATVGGTLDFRRTTSNVSINLQRTEQGGHQGWCVDNLVLDL